MVKGYKMKFRIRLYCAVIISILLSSGCVNTKKATYFVDQQNASINASNETPASVITENDLLSITVTSLSSQASTVFNTANNAGMASINQSENVLQPSGYLVSKDGFIKFPFLGSIKVAGLSELQLEDNITAALLEKKLVLDPIVTVRHLNFKVTVLGEVNHPTVLKVASEKISFLEALGLAGDLTIYAKRDNVLLIREEKNAKVIRRINLNSSSFLTSPYYYLKSNDIIYVEPNKAKLASTGRAHQVLPVVFAALTFFAIVIDRFTR
jgi:polysaccharide export outer membrane protein